MHTERWTIYRFQSVDFGVNSNIYLGEDGLHLGEYVFRQSYSFFISVSNLSSAVDAKGRKAFEVKSNFLSFCSKNIHFLHHIQCLRSSASDCIIFLINFSGD